MYTRIQDKIADYRQLVAAQERELAQLEAECAALRSEIAEFEARYNAQIKPLMDQLDAVKAAVQSLRELQARQVFEDVAVDVDSLWQAAPRIEPQPRPNQPDEPLWEDGDDPDAVRKRNPINSKANQLKQVYRQLARRFHPDYAQDEEDRSHRTRLMALINTAYQEGDLEALQLLDTADDATTSEADDSQLSLATLELRRLQQRHHDLARQIRQIKEARSELRYGSLMEMKLQESLARARGEDLLADLAAELQAEYWGYVTQLDALKASLE